MTRARRLEKRTSAAKAVKRGDLLLLRLKTFVGLRPFVFVPRTLWRTWGTRPVPQGIYGTAEAVIGALRSTISFPAA
jgi:hypothetical protein